jgi:hypothetical protein
MITLGKVKAIPTFIKAMTCKIFYLTMITLGKVKAKAIPTFIITMTCKIFYLTRHS